MWKRPLRDVVLRCHVGNLRVAGVMARATVDEAARRWALPAASDGARLWAEYMAGTAMFSAFFKGEERVKLMVRSPAIREIYVEAMAVGEVRRSFQRLLSSVFTRLRGSWVGSGARPR
jgi:redox-regulated HSP33 family molecular chaperone